MEFTLPEGLKKVQAEDLVWSGLLLLLGIYTIYVFSGRKHFTYRCHRIHTDEFWGDMGSQSERKKEKRGTWVKKPPWLWVSGSMKMQNQAHKDWKY